MAQDPTAFRDAYVGTPPWDIGRPQPEVIALANEGLASGSVLDVGCGTGENTLHLAARGLRVLGIDIVPTAIERARTKAKERFVDAAFLVHDALDLPSLRRRFKTVIDVGFLHVLGDADRERYVQGLAAVMRPGGRYFVLCFSDREPSGWGGPRRLTQRELEGLFSGPVHLDWVRPTRFLTRLHADGAHAWLAGATRVARAATRRQS